MPFDSKINIHITLSSFANIHVIESIYKWDKDEMASRTPVDIKLEFEIEHLEVGPTEHIYVLEMPTRSLPPTSPTPLDVPSITPTTSPRLLLTHATILYMDPLA